MGTQGIVAEVSDTPRFTQTCVTGRTMRFRHDSFPGLFLDASALYLSSAGKDAAVRGLSTTGATSPLPVRLQGREVVKAFFLTPFPVFAKDNTLVCISSWGLSLLNKRLGCADESIESKSTTVPVRTLSVIKGEHRVTGVKAPENQTQPRSAGYRAAARPEARKVTTAAATDTMTHSRKAALCIY
ncbi:unnamed protein product [Pleuronectes platessa]|uniref:Uncharacterized protein n=1 Tax=Pleuronectes platessa TaxID=8262 RepID=A0A9N7TRW7_PLEPL|nr:unnamed protein product [Pleuronectes platessa]